MRVFVDLDARFICQRRCRCTLQDLLDGKNAHRFVPNIALNRSLILQSLHLRSDRYCFESKIIHHNGGSGLA